MSKQTSQPAGATAWELLTIALIILRLCKVITWPWWQVLSPMLIAAAIVIILVIVALFTKK